MAYKVGDWVTETIPRNGKIVNFRDTYFSRNNIMDKIDTVTFKIGHITSPYICEGERDLGDGIAHIGVRYATPEEIRTVNGASIDNYTMY